MSGAAVAVSGNAAVSPAIYRSSTWSKRQVGARAEAPLERGDDAAAQASASARKCCIATQERRADAGWYTMPRSGMFASGALKACSAWP